MCNCGRKRSPVQNVQRTRLSPVRPRAAAPEPSNNVASFSNTSRSFVATPTTPDEERKRIEKLRRDAIRKAFGR